MRIARLIGDLGENLVTAADLLPGQRVLDVAAGMGNATLPAARTGADVTATDLIPELMAVGERAARAEGLPITWVEADARALPFDDGEFDVVLSCVGAMFAPDHAATARELLRVCRSGGRLSSTGRSVSTSRSLLSGSRHPRGTGPPTLPTSVDEQGRHDTRGGEACGPCPR